MTLYLLNNLSTVALVALVGGGSTLVAMAATVAIRKAFPNLAEAEASKTVSAEANAVAQLARSATVFPADATDAINDSVREYLRAVADDEWLSMRSGQSSPRAAAALDGLYAVYQDLSPQTAVEQAFYEASVDDLGEVTLQRRERLLQSQESLSPLLRVLLPVGAVVFVVLGYPASVRSLAGQLVIVGATAAFVPFAYLLTIVLDRPFAGDVAVANAPLKQGALARYWAFEGPPAQLDPDRIERLSPEYLVGVWNSDNAFGVMVFRQVGGEIRGAYRNDGGAFVGRIGDDGVLRGGATQQRGRGRVEAPRDSGRPATGPRRTVEVRGGGSPQGWGLTRLPGTEPPDLATQYEDPFCRYP